MLEYLFIGMFVKRTVQNTVKSGGCEYAPQGAVENEEIKVLWGINIQRDNLRETRQPDLIVIDKKEQKGIIIDIAVPGDLRVEEK